MSATSSSSTGPLATNRKARHEYHILETWEAGLALTGGEVKSCRAGHASLNEAHAAFTGRELFVEGMTIQPYVNDVRGFRIHDAARPKKVLMHRKELDRLFGLLQLKGHTIVPLKLYVARGKIKIEMGLGKGKQLVDKRETLKAKTDQRETARAIANATRR